MDTATPTPTLSPAEQNVKDQQTQIQNYYQILRTEISTIKLIAKELGDGNSQGVVAAAMILTVMRGGLNIIISHLQKILVLLSGGGMPPQG